MFVEDSTTSAISPSIAVSSPRTTRAPTTTRRQRPSRPGPTTVRALTETDIINKITKTTPNNVGRTKRPPAKVDNTDSESAHIPHIIVASHPQVCQPNNYILIFLNLNYYIKKKTITNNKITTYFLRRKTKLEPVTSMFDMEKPLT